MDKKNLVLIVIIIVLLFVILSGIIFYIFVANKPDGSDIREITVNKDIVLYEFGASFVNNVKDSKKMAKLTVKVEIDKKLVELMDYRKPEIIDKINLIMRDKTEKDWEGVEAQLKVKAEIKDAIKEILSTGKTIEVYIEEIIVQG